MILNGVLGGFPGSCARLWRPCYDCTNCCYVIRGSIMGAQGERGSCGGQERWIVYCVTERPGWANIYMSLRMWQWQKDLGPANWWTCLAELFERILEELSSTSMEGVSYQSINHLSRSCHCWQMASTTWLWGWTKKPTTLVQGGLVGSPVVKLRYVVYADCCIGFSRLSPVGDNIQLSNLFHIFTAPSCYCCLVLSCIFTSVVCFVFCLMLL